MVRTLQYLCLPLLLSSASGNANSNVRKQAVVNVGGLNDIQGTLLRTAKLDTDPSSDASSNLEMKNLVASSNQLSSAQSSATDSFDSLDSPTSKEASTAQNSAIDSLDTETPTSTEVADLAGKLAQDDSNKTSDSDPETDKAISGIDAELKRENDAKVPTASDSWSDTDNNKIPLEKRPLKFGALNKLLTELQTEQKENGDLDKSIKELDQGANDHMDQDKQAESSDPEQSLADLKSSMDQSSLLPNAASLLQLNVDDETNRRMSGMLHRMGNMGAHMKHLTRRIEGLQRLHDASQNGASLLQLSRPQLPSRENIKMESAMLANSAKKLDKQLKVKQEKGQHQASLASQNSLSQMSSDKEAMTWANQQLEKHGGIENIDHAADQRLMDELLAKFESKYS